MSFLSSIAGAMTDALADKADSVGKPGNGPDGDSSQLESAASQLKDAFEKELGDNPIGGRLLGDASRDDKASFDETLGDNPLREIVEKLPFGADDKLKDS